MDERILVLPNHRIRRCRSRDDVPASEFGGKLAGNLRQLLGFDIVGCDRSKRFEAGGTGNKFYRFEDVSWFHHPDVSTAVPLFGSQSQKHASLMEHYKPSGLSLPTFKRMLTDTAPSRVVDGWQRRPPPDVTHFANGASLLGLPAAVIFATQPVVNASTLPNFAANTFIFDAAGARVGGGHAAAAVSDGEGEPPAAVVQETTAEGPPAKKQRRARTRRILTQAPGMEASADGEERIETEAPRQPGMFTASNYFWLYYAAEGVRGLTKQVGVNEGSGPHGAAAEGEYHAILSNAADVDADSIAGSNSTYDFTGMDASRPELLYIRTYSCACER